MVKTKPIAYCGSFRGQFWVANDLFTDLTIREATVLCYRRNFYQPVELMIVLIEKIPATTSHTDTLV